MKNKCLLLVFLISFLSASAQKGYEIKINLKNCKDTVAYLAFYQFDKMYVADTCKKVVGGKIIFAGKKNLDTGVYFLLSQSKSNYFDFIVDATTQRQQINSDMIGISEHLEALNSKQNANFFNYVRYVASANKELDVFKKKLSQEKNPDSTALIRAEYKKVTPKMIQKDLDCIAENKGTYLSDLINMKSEKEATTIPKASNGRPDSLYAYNYYKSHYWDGVNFQDDASLRNPFFANKLKKYYNSVVMQHPDSICVEIDKMLLKTKPETKMNMLLIAYFTQTYEMPTIMGMDKVFVHMVDNYFKTGKAKGIYDESVIKLIIDKGYVLSPLLLGKKAPDLNMIEVSNQSKIANMGFESAKTSEELTKIYYDNQVEIEKNFLNLYSIKADYLILLFWDVDCGHCQKEVPKILETYHDLQKEGKDVKVLSVYTLYEFEKYKKYISEHKLDWINVYDGAHVNDLRRKYDVVTTPVIYVLDKNKTIKAKRINADNIKSIIATMALEYEKNK